MSGKRRKWLIGLKTHQLRLCLEKQRVDALRSAPVLYVRPLATQLCPLVCPGSGRFRPQTHSCAAPNLATLSSRSWYRKGHIILWHSIRTSDRVPSLRAAPRRTARAPNLFQQRYPVDSRPGTTHCERRTRVWRNAPRRQLFLFAIIRLRAALRHARDSRKRVCAHPAVNRKEIAIYTHTHAQGSAHALVAFSQSHAVVGVTRYQKRGFRPVSVCRMPGRD